MSSVESQKILAAFEAAKKERIDRDDRAKLEQQKLFEENKAEITRNLLVDASNFDKPQPIDFVIEFAEILKISDTPAEVTAENKKREKQIFAQVTKANIQQQVQLSKEGKRLQAIVTKLEQRLKALKSGRGKRPAAAIQQAQKQLAAAKLALEKFLTQERIDNTIKAKTEQQDFFTSLGKSIGTALEVLNNPIAATQNLFTQIFFELNDVTALRMLEAKKIQLEGLALIASDSQLKAIQAGGTT